MYTPLPTHSVFHVDSFQTIELCESTIHEVTGSSFELPRDFNRKFQPQHNIYTCQNCKSNYDIFVNDLKKLYKKFPNCCNKHKMLLKADWFEKKAFKDVPELVAEKVFFTYGFILDNIDSPNWGTECHDYIYHMVMTFGSFPNGYGSPFLLGDYFDHLIKLIKFTNYDEEKKKLIISLIKEIYNKGNYVKEDENSFKSLLKTYNKWYRAFPFDLNIFSNLKKYFAENIPIYETTHYNKYLELSLATTVSKVKLISYLKEVTAKIISTINGAYLYENGLLDDTTQYKLSLIISRRKLQSKLSYTSSQEDIKEIFNDTINKWFDDELAFINDITPILKEIESSNKKDSGNLFKKILFACNRLQENKTYWDADENTRNKYILDLLSSHYQTKDQSQYGSSSSGIKPGSVDGVIIDQNDIEYFIEALNLKSLDKSYLLLHINKLEKNYDSKGLKTKYLISYCNVPDSTFESFFIKYKYYVEEECTFHFKVKKSETVSCEYTNQRILKTTHSREDKEVILYHILLKMPIGSIL